MDPFDWKLAQKIPCDCGRTHFVPLRRVNCDLWQSDFSEELHELLGGKRVLLLCDKHTRQAINTRLTEYLRAHDWKVTLREFNSPNPLVNDETVVGTAVLDMTADVNGILAVGGGTITDLGRFVASRMGKPFALVMTCPSMDGYASNVAGMMIGGKKKVLKDCKFPDGLFADPEVLRTAPMELLQSGYGDMLGKRTALPDWILAREMDGAFFCRRTADQVAQSAAWCGESAAVAALLAREGAAVGRLTESLILTGINMALCEDTRPASGSEHIFSHYLVNCAIEAGGQPPTHGASVGFGTLVSTRLYEYLLEEVAPEELRPLEGELRQSLLPGDLVYALLEQSGIGGGYGRYLPGCAALATMIRACAGPDKRYTILRYLSDRGMLESAIYFVQSKMKG